jgi:integration host factor subunit beta
MAKKNKESLQDIVESIQSKHSEFSPVELENILKVAFGEVATGITCGDRVELRGFASMVVRKRCKRVARNPRTNQKVEVDDKGSLYFRASRELIGAINS